MKQVMHGGQNVLGQVMATHIHDSDGSVLGSRVSQMHWYMQHGRGFDNSSNIKLLQK